MFRLLKDIAWIIIPYSDPNSKIKAYIRFVQRFSGISKKTARFISNVIFYKFNCIISPTAKIAEDCIFVHPVGVMIGAGAVIKNRVVIWQHVTLAAKSLDRPLYPIIEEDCLIYANSILVGNITISKGTTIGANSLCVKSMGGGGMFRLLKDIIWIIIPYSNPGSKCQAYVRFMQRVNRISKKAAKFISNVIFYKFSCIISPSAKIAKDCIFVHPIGVVIGDGVIIKNRVRIWQNVSITAKSLDEFLCPIIEEDCLIYMSSTLVGNITISKGTTIGANSFCAETLEGGGVWVGNPIKKLKP